MADKTEKEKMLAGEIYNCLDPDLDLERQQVRSKLRIYNQTTPEMERQTLLAEILGKVGEESVVESPFHCVYGKNIYLGDRVFLNVHCALLDCNEIRIGNHVMVGPYVQIYTAAHEIQAAPRIEGWEVAKPITIEENVWIGGNAILLPGVRVGVNAVVGAGSVVSRDVPPDTVVAGNPARVIRVIDNK